MTSLPQLAASAGRPRDLLALGECMVELWAETPLGQADCLQRAYGGDVLNTLVMASRLGSRTGFISKVGNDPFGRALLEAFRQEGVDTTHCPLVRGENGVYFISLLLGGEREFSYRRRASAASSLSPADLKPDYLASGRLLLLSGITQALSEEAEAATLAAAQHAKAHGLTVAYDPNYRPRLWLERQSGESGAWAAFERLCPLVDLLLPSFPADCLALGLAADTPAAAAAALAERGFPLVALKAAAEGAIVVHGGQLERAPAERVTVKDATGAGDAWNGGFLHALLQGATPFAAARFANRTAAWKLAYRGAIPAVAADDLQLLSLRGVVVGLE